MRYIELVLLGLNAAYGVFMLAELASKTSPRMEVFGVSFPKPVLLLPYLVATVAYLFYETRS